MIRDLTTIERIQKEKAKQAEASALQPLDPEGVEMAKHKRFTFDIIDVPVDPLR